MPRSSCAVGGSGDEDLLLGFGGGAGDSRGDREGGRGTSGLLVYFWRVAESDFAG